MKKQILNLKINKILFILAIIIAILLLSSNVFATEEANQKIYQNHETVEIKVADTNNDEEAAENTVIIKAGSTVNLKFVRENGNESNAWYWFWSDAQAGDASTVKVKNKTIEAIKSGEGSVTFYARNLVRNRISKITIIVKEDPLAIAIDNEITNVNNADTYDLNKDGFITNADYMKTGNASIKTMLTNTDTLRSKNQISKGQTIKLKAYETNLNNQLKNEDLQWSISNVIKISDLTSITENIDNIVTIDKSGNLNIKESGYYLTISFKTSDNRTTSGTLMLQTIDEVTTAVGHNELSVIPNLSKDGVTIVKFNQEAWTTICLADSDLNNKVYNIPATVKIASNDYKITGIKDGAFNDSILENLKIGLNVKDIEGGAFTGTTKLKAITVDENNRNYESKNGVLYTLETDATSTKWYNTIIKYPEAKAETDKIFMVEDTTTEIAKEAFINAQLEYIYLPDGITEIGDGAFKGNTVLKELFNKKYKADKTATITAYSDEIQSKGISTSLPNSLSYIGAEAFSGCTNLINLRIPGNSEMIIAIKYDDTNEEKFNEIKEKLKQAKVFSGITNEVKYYNTNGKMEAYKSLIPDGEAILTRITIAQPTEVSSENGKITDNSNFENANKEFAVTAYWGQNTYNLEIPVGTNIILKYLNNSGNSINLDNWKIELVDDTENKGHSIASLSRPTGKDGELRNQYKMLSANEVGKQKIKIYSEDFPNLRSFYINLDVIGSEYYITSKDEATQKTIVDSDKDGFLTEYDYYSLEAGESKTKLKTLLDNSKAYTILTDKSTAEALTLRNDSTYNKNTIVGGTRIGDESIPKILNLKVVNDSGIEQIVQWYTDATEDVLTIDKNTGKVSIENVVDAQYVRIYAKLAKVTKDETTQQNVYTEIDNAPVYDLHIKVLPSKITTEYGFSCVIKSDGTAGIVGYDGSYQNIILAEDNEEHTTNATFAYEGVRYTITSLEEGAFSSSSIKTITLNNNIRNINEGAINGCTSLTNLNIKNTNNLTIQGGFAKGCSSLQAIKLFDSTTSTYVETLKTSGNYSVYDGVLYSRTKDNENAVLVKYPEAKVTTDGQYIVLDGTKELANYAFANNKNITDLVMPDGLEKLGRKSLYNMEKVTTLCIPSTVTEVADISQLIDESSENKDTYIIDQYKILSTATEQTVIKECQKNIEKRLVYNYTYEKCKDVIDNLDKYQFPKVIGDVNEDGKLDEADKTLMSKICNGEEEGTELTDFTGDGITDLFDYAVSLENIYNIDRTAYVPDLFGTRNIKVLYGDGLDDYMMMFANNITPIKVMPNQVTLTVDEQELKGESGKYSIVDKNDAVVKVSYVDKNLDAEQRPILAYKFKATDPTTGAISDIMSINNETNIINKTKEGTANIVLMDTYNVSKTTLNLTWASVPVISGVENGKTYYINSNLNVKITEDNLKSVEGTFDGNKIENLTSESNDLNFDKEGSYKLIATDIYENKTQVEFSIIIDKTLPTIAGVENNKVYSLKGTKKVEITVSDKDDKNNTTGGITTIIQKKNGMNWENVTPTITDGKYTIGELGEYKITAKDKAENTTSEINFKVIIDNTAPIISGVTNETTYIIGEEETKNIIVTDKDDAGNATENTTVVISKKSGDNWVTYNPIVAENKYSITDAGEYKATATDIAGNETTVLFKVNKKLITKIEVTTLPTAKQIENTELDLTGGIITVTYDDNSTNQIDISSKGVVISGYDKTKIGTQVLVAKYANHTDEFEIEVKAKTISKIEITKNPTTLIYVKGSELNLADGEITVTYDNGQTEKIGMTNSKIKITGYDKTKLGSQQITAEYESKTVRLGITVIEKYYIKLATSTLINGKYYVEKGKTYQITMAKENGTSITDFNVTYRSDKTEVATISETGLITIVNDGTTNIEILKNGVIIDSIEITTSKEKQDTVVTSANTTVETYKESIENLGTIVIKDSTDKVLTDKDILTTGDKVYINGEFSYTVIVKADINGDRKIDLVDAILILKQIKYTKINKSIITGVYLSAADVDGNSKVDVIDVIKVIKFSKGKITKF